MLKYFNYYNLSIKDILKFMIDCKMKKVRSLEKATKNSYYLDFQTLQEIILRTI